MVIYILILLMTIIYVWKNVIIGDINELSLINGLV